MKKNLLFAMICSVLVLSSCKEKEGQEKTELNSGIKFENLDTTANPKDDFYKYACGGWQKNNPLTGEYSRYGSFDQLAENNQLQLKEVIVDLASQKHEAGSIAQKVGDLYNIGMDTVTIEKQGAQPIVELLQGIAAMKDRKELTAKMVELANINISPFFGVFGEADPQNSSMTIAWMWQTGLGIGDRDYYLEPNMQNIRDEYVVFLTKLLQLSGYGKMAGFENDEALKAAEVLKLESAMAKIFMDKVELRDPFKTYNYMSVADVQKMLTAIDVEAYLTGLGLDVDSVNVGQVNYLKNVNKLIALTPFDIIKTYLACNVINSAADYLSNDFVQANFDFYGKTLSGKTEMKPRWKRVIATVDGSLGEAVGQMYVEKYFPAEAKERMLHLVKNLQSALGDRIKQNTWMTEATKEKALDKLSAFIIKIGYPEKWRDYSSLEIKDDSYYGNIMRAAAFENRYQMAKIGKKLDPTEWLMTPQTVNAYYNPTTNEICFPAAILQPPFFDMTADDAVNYGAIGVVIGHEMTHGFDDQGRNYDKNGNLNNWWAEEDSKNFNERAQVLVDYFNSIEVLPGVFANGAFTLGENIADNGGLNVSYTALQKAKAEGGIQENMDGFTAEQRFFIAYAGVWANNIRDEEILRRTKVDEHSLGSMRVNATLKHITPFVEAFDIHEGDGMWIDPANRANIW
ncbi:MAG: M13 family metallopeptidase [Bacteroidales bacterium]|nr:M13 family metallopeptidase [Bacteroidales bacterium]